MRTLVVLALLAACKGKHDKPAPNGPAAPAGSAAGSASAPPSYTVDAKCEAAVKKAAAAPLDARPQILIDGCHVCGDWTPILRWNTLPQEGGPARTAIEKAMLDCHAYCDPNAKQRFLGALDAARGTNMRTPWRELAEVCRDQVSAVPDARFMGGPFFALDRIARAIGTKGGDLVTAAGNLELPLPPVSPTGVGPVLADVDGVTPKVGEIQVTVLGDKIFVGRMPRAHLAAGGVSVELGPNGYPGIETELAKLPEALRYAIGDSGDATIVLLAPHAMPAENLVPIVTAAAPVAPLYLAANAVEAPEGWTLAAAIPVALATTGDPVHVTAEMSVQQLAAAIAQHKGSRVVLRSP